MKICLIGNSHVASLKKAWDKIEGDYPHQEITFFAQRAAGLDGLVAHNGKLIANNKLLEKALEFTSGGKKEIDPGNYDFFIIYGAWAAAYFVDNTQFYSKSVIKIALNNRVENTLSFKLLKALRALTDKKVFVGHCPLAAAKDVLFDTTPDDYLAGLRLINNLIYYPLNAELVSQPLITIVNGKNTRPDLSKGSKRLAVGEINDDEIHPDDENEHMNDKFGEIWLREFLGKYVEI